MVVTVYYRTRTLFIAPGHCISHQDTVYRTRTLYIAPGHCISHQDTVYRIRTLYIAPGHCISHQDTVYRTRKLYIIALGNCSILHQETVRLTTEQKSCSTANVSSAMIESCTSSLPLEPKRQLEKCGALLKNPLLTINSPRFI